MDEWLGVRAAIGLAIQRQVGRAPGVSASPWRLPGVAHTPRDNDARYPPIFRDVAVSAATVLGVLSGNWPRQSRRPGSIRVRLPTAGFAREMVDLLRHLLVGGEPASSHILPFEIVRRASGAARYSRAPAGRVDRTHNELIKIDDRTGHHQCIFRAEKGCCAGYVVGVEKPAERFCRADFLGPILGLSMNAGLHPMF